MNNQLKNLKIGQEITIISKGIRHGNTDYIMQDEIGKASFMQITKIGNKYIYGKWIYFNPTNGKKEYNWEDKINTDDYLIFPTIRHDLKQKYQQYKDANEQYKTDYKNAVYDIESELYNIKRQKIDQWQNQHQRPENTIQEYEQLLKEITTNPRY